jgi:hypothetical protein
MVDVSLILKEFSSVKTRRSPWENVWELIARYIFQRKQGFTTISAPGDFYTHEDVLDNTAGQAHQTMVSSLDGALWKNGGRTFRICKPRQARDTREIKEFYAEVNARTQGAMEHENAGWGTARQEAFSEGTAFGTDAIGVFKAPPGKTHKVEYRAMPLKNLYVVEDSRGKVIKEFYEYEYDAFQLVGEYGDVAKTDKVKAALDVNNRETKFKVVWLVRPNESSETIKYSYESIHVLSEDNLVLRHSGFSGNSIIVSRFYKNEGEEYGRSPGYNALSPTIELNGVVEIITQGGELTALPSWYILDDGSFGNGTIDRSPGGVIPIDATSSRITGMAPIGQIGSVGSLMPLLKLMEMLIQEIKMHFLNDKLTDLNNTTRMTLGEAQIRNELRADNTGAIFSRQLDEKFTPVIRRTIAILEEEGELGTVPGTEIFAQLVAAGRAPLVIPAELLDLREQGIEIYPIEYISPAARILRSEEIRGLMSLWQFAATFSAAAPELMFWINKRKTMPLVKELYGAPDDSIVSEEEFEKSFADYQKQMANQQQIQSAAIAAEIAKNSASANQQNAQANATRSGMNGMTNGGGAGNPADMLT